MAGIDDVSVVHDDPDVDLPVTRGDDLPVLDDAPRRQYALPPDWPEGAKMQDDGSVKLKLDYPVTLKFRAADGSISKGETYAELHLHRLTGKHQRELRTADEDDLKAQMMVCSAGITLGRARLLHDAMDASDIGAMLQVVNFFIRPGRKITPAS